MIVPFHVTQMLSRVRERFSEETLAQQMSPTGELPAPLRPVRCATPNTVQKFWQYLTRGPAEETDQNVLADNDSLEHATTYSGNIENYIGTVKVPVGVIGPLRVKGMNASGDFHVPLATTEAALVASYHRGAMTATKAGGINTAVLYEGVIRTPAFVLKDVVNSGLFVEWVVNNVEQLKAEAESTTRYGKLTSIEPVIDTNVVFLICRYTTGDASGQNMVTIATHAMATSIVENCPVEIQRWYIEGSFSGDKKASFLGMVTGRGRKVSASVTIPAEVVEKCLGASVQQMLDYCEIASLGAMLSGQFGVQAHYANCLAAFYIATGQDAACVAESAVGFTRMESRDGALFCSVTMPNILTGTVGGGTGLPSQQAALNILGLSGEGNGAALAEVAAATCLCGELSIIAAIASDDFTRAHQSLARQR